ncbi:MAG: hypothetical protein CMO74_08540 [Verrucomicrobiales bacterium]|nr:hypothetical protein [Verrucomicrobiales bacterium]|tara:strand:- start:3114 stop:3929 length:816 start_codon:yes stop_codon:yes gene_type:complete
MQIFINRDGQQFGPFTLDQVNQGLATGQLLPTDFAFFEGLAQWTPLNQIQGVIIPGALAPMAVPVEEQPAAAQPEAQPDEEPVADGETVAAEAESLAEGTAKKKKILMIAGIAIGVTALAFVLLYVWPGFLKGDGGDGAGAALTPSSYPSSNTPPPPPDDGGSTDVSLPDISGMESVSYFGDIKPILEAKCVSCHGKETTKAKLDLSDEQGLAAGADGEPVYVAGKPEESEFVLRIMDVDDPMPPDDEEPLTDDEKKKIVAWISQGAPTDK